MPRPRREQLGAALRGRVALALRRGLPPLEHAALVNDIGFGASGPSRTPQRGVAFEAITIATTHGQEQHHKERVDGPKDGGIRQVRTGHAAIIAAAAGVEIIVVAASVAAVHRVEDAAEESSG